MKKEEIKIKKTGKYACFILLVSDRDAHNYYAWYEGCSYKEALRRLRGVDIGEETKNAYIQGIILTKEQRALTGDELHEAILNAGLYDESSSIIITKG
ncbi:MAG: hypothetical protein PHQ01_04620, partial [Candidatus Pacebacteria bacterium]|nr:hypothetical protein [Candidatus Paceibacterota bacterium]